MAEEVVEDELTLDDISFRDKSLAEWEEELTVKMPALPTTSLAIQNTVVRLNNQYQIAYNCYNELMVLYTSTSKVYKRLLDIAIKEKVIAFTAEGVKKFPSRDNLETICSEESNSVRLAYDNKVMYGLIRDFFENNKSKLEKSMALVLNVSWSTGQSDKMNFKSGDPRL